MNENFIELNDNFGIVNDDTGNANFISKKTNEYSFEDILSKENEIEDLYDKLDKIIHELLNKEVELKMANVFDIFSIFSIVLSLIIALVIREPFQTAIQTAITGTVTGIIISQIAKFTIVGRKSKVKDKIRKLITRANDLETNLDTLQKELTEMKAKVDYKKNNNEVLTIPDKNYDYDEIMEYNKYNNHYNEIIESNQNNSKKYKIKTLKK